MPFLRNDVAIDLLIYFFIIPNSTIKNEKDFKNNLMLNIEKTYERKEAAQKIIRRHIFLSAGLGFIPFPAVDAAAILGNQVFMLRGLSKVYEIPFKEHRVKSFISSLVGNLGAIGVVKFIPGLGSFLGGATVSAGATAATYALGKIFMQHFDQGGTLLDFDPVKSRKYFQQLQEEGKVAAQSLKTEKEVVIAKSSSSQNLLMQAPIIEATTLEQVEQPEVIAPPVPATQTVNDKKTISSSKPSIFHRLKWLVYLLIVAIIGWALWLGYSKYIVEKNVESSTSTTSKDGTHAATTEIPNSSVADEEMLQAKDSTNRKDVQD